VIEMIDFWLLAALLLLAALSFVWWPVLMQRRQLPVKVSRKDLNVQAFESQIADLDAELQAGRIEQAQYDSLKVELERNLLGDVAAQKHAQTSQTSHKGLSVTAILLSVVVLVGGLGLYLKLGSSDTLQQMAEQQSFAQKLSQLAPEQRLAFLEQELANNPQRTDILYALTNVYFQQGRVAETKNTYDRLLAAVGEEPSLLAEYAQAVFFMNGNRITAEVTQLAERALRVQPRNLSALGLLGIDAFEKGRYGDAIAAWQAALETAPDAQGADALRQGIARAQQLLGAQPEPATGAKLTLLVSLDETLAGKVQPEQSVFVLARAIKGPKIPLAVKRLKVKDLPAEVILSDAMAMTAELKLSSVDEVEVLARVSTSGQPIAQTGDLQGSFRPVNVSAQQTPIKLVIDQIVE